MMIAGVISRSPSHETPPYGCRERLRADRRRGSCPGSTSSNSNVPFSSVFASWMVSAVLLQLDDHAGRPSSPSSTWPGLPPPGLKSRQTTPLIPPASGFRLHRLLRLARHLLGRDRRSGRVDATSPGCEGSSSAPSRRPDVCCTDVSRRRCLREHARRGERVLNRRGCPRSPRPGRGPVTYMIRHVTPAAKAEIAIGMNTTVLNATDQLTRSVSTANMSPSAVTSAGTTATQIALFLIAVTRTSFVKSCS